MLIWCMEERKQSYEVPVSQFEENCLNFIDNVFRTISPAYPSFSFLAFDLNEAIYIQFQEELERKKKNMESVDSINQVQWMLDKINVLSASMNIATVIVRPNMYIYDEELVEKVHRNMSMIASDWGGHENVPDLIKTIYNPIKQPAGSVQTHFFVFE